MNNEHAQIDGMLCHLRFGIFHRKSQKLCRTELNLNRVARCSFAEKIKLCINL